MSALGLRVKELRAARGLTQQKLAEQAEISHSLVSALESGRRKYVSTQDVERLARGLDVPSEELWKLIPGGKREARYISIFGVPGSETQKAA